MGGPLLELMAKLQVDAIKHYLWNGISGDKVLREEFKEFDSISIDGSGIS